MKTDTSPRRLLLLQAVVILYTLSSVMAKFASGQEAPGRILFFFGMDLFFLGLYALFWQQLIKTLPLSVAYANRAMALLWSALWQGWSSVKKSESDKWEGLSWSSWGFSLLMEKEVEQRGRKGQNEAGIFSFGGLLGVHCLCFPDSAEKRSPTELFIKNTGIFKRICYHRLRDAYDLHGSDHHSLQES